MLSEGVPSWSQHGQGESKSGLCGQLFQCFDTEMVKDSLFDNFTR